MVAPDISRRHNSDSPCGENSNLERHYGILLPNDFKNYLLTSCPASTSWDSEMGCWWDIDRIKNIPDEYKREIKEQDIRSLCIPMLVLP